MNWYIYSMIAALLMAAAVILEKKNLNKIHALEFSTETSFYGLLFSFFLLPWVELHLHFSTYLLLLVQGTTALFAFLLFNKALRHSDVSEAAPLTNFDIVTTLLFSSLFLGDFPKLPQIAGMLFILAGTYLLELPPHGSYLDPFKSFTKRKGLYLMLPAMLLYGLNKTLGKIALDQVSPITLIFFAYLVFFVGYVILDLFFFRENITKLRGLLKTHGPGLFMTSLAVFGYRLFMTFAIASGSVSLVTAVTRTSTLFSAFGGGKLFAEKNLNRRLVASAVILFGVLFIIL
ncbi:MAG: DMT family transporter [bacterium]|nr:DMT family transporter [bacterium]